MGFIIDKPINYLRAGPFKISRPAHIRFLVKPGLKLHQGNDILSPLGSFDKGFDNGAIFGSPIKRLFDSHDMRIEGGLLQELNNDLKFFIRVMNQNIFSGDGRKTVPVKLANTFWETRFERWK